MPNPAPHEKRSPRERILDTAGALFYAEGVRAVGVDRVVDESGVARMTLYNQFGSKDGLVAAWLARRDAAWMSWLEERVAALGGTVEAVFDALAEWFASDTFRGCAFINTQAEIGESNETVAALVRAHKRALLGFLEQVARAAGAKDAGGVAAELLVLVEGAIVTASIGTVADPAQIAKRAASRLVA
jgi:AcrR family transcriptional regulator